MHGQNHIKFKMSCFHKMNMSNFIQES